MLDSDSSRFLETVAETSRSRERIIKKRFRLFRAQLGNDIDPIDEYGRFLIVPYAEERLRPFADRAQEGRSNPKGIPVFYCATRVKTAIAEMRPWIGSYVSYGRFATTRSRRLVDCTKNSMGKRTMSLSYKYAFEEPDPDIRESWVWHDIDAAFSEPVARDDDRAEYVPTQIISEQFRTIGFDEMMYRSSIDVGGINVALFDLSCVDFISGGIVRISKLSLEFEEGEEGWIV